MAKYNGNVSLGFEAFDRAYEPEIMSLCSSINACSAGSVSAKAYNDIGYSISIDNPGTITIKDTLANAIAAVGDSSYTMTNQLDEFVRRVKELEKAVYGEKEDYIRGYTNPAYSYKLKIGRVSRISRSQLLTI
jgi:hypothetical protein